MFRVYYKGVIRTVYNVELWNNDGKTYFLLYHNDKWLWVNVSKTKPVEDSVCHG